MLSQDTALMMEAVSTSETSVSFCQTAWCKIPEVSPFRFLKLTVPVLRLRRKGRIEEIGWQLTLLRTDCQIVVTVVSQYTRIDGSALPTFTELLIRTLV
jgi:hypothetical protein